MDKASKKITNIKQFELLVDLMVKNPAVARGYGGFNMAKADFKNAWNEYSEKLNSIGPPIRDGDGWLKVWSDYKNKIKKKMQHNKKELSATGGGENKLYHFSVLENLVIDLLSLEKIVEPSGKEFGLSSSNIQAANDEIEICEDAQENENVNNSNLKSGHPKSPAFFLARKHQRKERQIKERQMEQLEEQTKILKNIDANLESSTQYVRKTYELKEKKFQVYENYLRQKLMLRKEKEKNEAN